MINLRKTLEIARTQLESAHISFALIGGFALSAHGIHRATKDIDLLVDGSKKEEIKKKFLSQGFKLSYESEEVLQFHWPGYLDIILANRPLSLEMLKNSSNYKLLDIPVVSPEGIIGLKIQAYKNDPSRKLQDLADIQDLLKIPGVNLNKIKEYADLFNEWIEIERLIK